MTVDRVLLASPRGFCAGVEMSVKALIWMVDAFGPPVYCYHEIVHNQRVVDRFQAIGVRFVDSIEEVPQGAPLMLSAHGSAPQLVEQARARSPHVVDAVCPLVTKVHHEVRQSVEHGRHIVYIGHRGHDEEAGTSAIAPDHVTVVASIAELPGEIDGPVAVLSQTTLSESQYEPIEREAARRYGKVWTPRRTDRCFATTNRQAAVKAIAPECDHLIVVGSPSSANTTALVAVAREAGCLDVRRAHTRAELQGSFAGTVGLTSGASAPEESVSEILHWLLDGDLSKVEEVVVADEPESFPAPRDLRELANVLRRDGRDIPDIGFVSDSSISASERLRWV